MRGFEQILDLTSAERMILAIPLFHSYGLIIALTSLFYGGSLVLVPRFQPQTLLAALAKGDVTVLPLVRTLYSVILQLLEKEPMTFPHLRFCVSGGASLPVALLNQIQARLGAPVIEGYGLTEASPVVAVNNPRTGSVPGSVGKPLPNVEVWI